MYEQKPDLEYIAHFGVKGMKWGVRKKRETSGTRKNHRKAKIAAGTALVVGAAVAGYFGYKKLSSLRVVNARNARITTDFLKQVSSIPTPKPQSMPILKFQTAPVSKSIPIYSQSAKTFTQMVNTSYDQMPLDDMLNSLNAELLNNIRGMMR